MTGPADFLKYGAFALYNRGLKRRVDQAIDRKLTSTNTSADTNKQLLAQLNVPAANCKPGSIIELKAWFENDSTATAKNMIVDLLNATTTTIGTQSNTTNQSDEMVLRFAIKDNQTVALLNNVATTAGGGGPVTGPILLRTVQDINLNGLQFGISGSFGAALASGYIWLHIGVLDVEGSL